MYSNYTTCLNIDGDTCKKCHHLHLLITVSSTLFVIRLFADRSQVNRGLASRYRVKKTTQNIIEITCEYLQPDVGHLWFFSTFNNENGYFWVIESEK